MDKNRLIEFLFREISDKLDKIYDNLKNDKDSEENSDFDIVNKYTSSRKVLSKLEENDKLKFVFLCEILQNDVLIYALDTLERRLVFQRKYSENMDQNVFIVYDSNKKISLDNIGETPSGGFTVRLNAWNCSCTEFALSYLTSTSNVSKDSWNNEILSTFLFKENKENTFWGGILNKQNVPCCRHIVACILGNNCGNFLNNFIHKINCSDSQWNSLILSSC